MSNSSLSAASSVSVDCGRYRGSFMARPGEYRPPHDYTTPRKADNILPPMIVQKFGGTSVGGADPIRRLCRIVSSALARQPVVVVSAVGGVTNRLFHAGELARSGGAWRPELEALEAQHRALVA